MLILAPKLQFGHQKKCHTPTESRTFCPDCKKLNHPRQSRGLITISPSKGRNAQTHMNVIRHQVPFDNLTTLLLRQLMKYLAQMLAQLTKHHFSPSLRDEYNVVFAIPSRVTQTLVLSHFGFSKLLIKFLRIQLTAL
jgi:hypothetical protein